MTKKILVALLCAASAFGAGLPAVKSVRLYVFDCGKLTVQDPIRFNFRKEELKTLDLSVGCYLIVHPKGTLMWDVGVVPDSFFDASGQPAVKEYATATKPLKAQMADAGYKPEDIKFLALSHYHWDHIANANDFAKATWLMRQVEKDTLFGPNPPERTSPDEYSDLYNSKSVDLKTGDYDVFGDGTVVIKPAFGHTPGHQVLFVKLKKTGPVLLSGDLYHYPEEITTGRIPMGDLDKEQTRQSRIAIAAFLKKTGAHLWIQHDLAAFSQLKKAPAWYE
jgi:N-acyl homoserine lactone hydrolase